MEIAENDQRVTFLHRVTFQSLIIRIRQVSSRRL